MSEKPQEQSEQQQSGDGMPSVEGASQDDSASLAASENGSDQEPEVQSPENEQAPEAVEGGSTSAEAPDTEATPEVPEADASSTVADAPSEPTADESTSAAIGSEESPPAPKAKPKKVDPAKVQPLEEVPAEELEEQEVLDRDWYILKVQSNREKSIRDALERRVKVAGLERFFGEVIVPTEDVAEYKNGKRKVTKRKLWPGYIVVNMAINDDTWFLVRETPGIGDFTGSIGKPVPMMPDEVERIMPKETAAPDDDPQIKIGIKFKPGDRVRVKDGYFQNFEGDVESIDEANGRVTVICSIFGRSTPVELEHWQVEDT